MTDHITFPIPTVVPKGWGQEVVLINRPEYCAKFLDFEEETKGSLHFHVDKRETWYILYGWIELTYINIVTGMQHTRTLRTGDMVDIPARCPHRVQALAQTRIVEVSTHHRDEDTYRIEGGDGQKDAKS